ncbi:hypothetical protein QEZ54_11340 [Catellatospora sp. KI3]|uniref:hypothetical protein n=1 Tax=Catellatospora sp. KI3 TaxID=3041620 RepID=UPI002482A24D|nr:hypothetical protein [Catellatospora sp. KI3]MDI1461567.1 hypothetical protein [Catellatospora sp. KI3]
MPNGSTIAVEPTLAVRSAATPFFRRGRFLWPFAAALACVVAGLAALAPAGHLLLPFQPTEVLQGRMASKGDYFEDPEVKRLLMGHHLQVNVTRMGSHDAAVLDTADADLVFTSGEASGNQLIDRRQQAQPPQFAKAYYPFTSFVVLATYREYAETLSSRGIATPQGGADGSLYYTLHLDKFLPALEAPDNTWNDLGLGRFGLSNGNRVVAHTPNICSANSAATYLGMLAYMKNGREVVTADGAEALARTIQPLVRSQGLPTADLFQPYLTLEGKSSAPVVVIYEHQFLSYQLHQKETTGEVDRSRVLLYPDPSFLVHPQLIALNSKADGLARLVATDPALRNRALEMGFRQLAPDAATKVEPLEGYLQSKGVQVPEFDSRTRGSLPDPLILEKMIDVAGSCRR